MSCLTSCAFFLSIKNTTYFSLLFSKEPDVSCNSSSNCSETDEDCESKEAASKRLLDLEDLAQILQK